MLKKFNNILRTLNRIFKVTFHLFDVTKRWYSICIAKNNICLTRGGGLSNKQHNSWKKKTHDNIENQLILMNS